MRHDRPSASWPPGAGEMAARVRAHPWAATPLGAIEDWPERLRAVVELVLESPLVSSLVCGPERVLLYNDAAARLYGARHPAALGRPLPDAFPEGWAAVGAPLYARVFAGETVQVAAQPLDLRGESDRAPDLFDATLTPVRDAAGRVVAAHMVGHEVGARVRAEARLRRSEQRQAFLLRLSDALRPLGDPAAVQGVAARLLGEHLGADRAYYVELDESRQVATVAQEYRRGEAPSLVGSHAFAAFGATLDILRAGRAVVFDDVETEARVRPADLPVYGALGLRAFLDTPLIKDGEPVCAMCVVSTAPRRWDAEEVALVEEVAERTWAAIGRARAERALRESERLFRTLADTAPALIWRNDARGENVFVNQCFLDFTGRSAAEIRGEGWRALIHPDEVEAYVADYLAAVRDRRAWQDRNRIRRHDGTWRWFENYAQPLFDDDGGFAGHVGVSTDVTASVEAEAALLGSEERFRSFAEASADTLWIVDADTRRLEYLSPAFEPMWGEARDRVMRLPGRWAELLHPDDRERVKTGLPRLLAGEVLTKEYRIVRPADGEVRWIRDTGFPVRDEAGRVRRVAGIARDVTALKAVGARLAESEGRLRTLMEGIPQLVWRSCDRGLWTWASPQWLSFTGQSQEESWGLGWLDAVHPDDREATLNAWEEAAAHGMLDAEYRVRRAVDGAWVWHHTRSTPVRDEGGRILEWLGTTTDVQQLKELQEGQAVLVAELQHRTRNLIAVVRAIARQTMAETGPTEAFQDAFGDRMAALARVQGLLSRAEAEPITIEALIRLELDALAGLDGARDRIRLDGPAVPLRNSVVQTLALALHELATNARKYGALATQTGRLSVTWSVREAEGGGRRLGVEWVEEGVDRSCEEASPATSGYGRELIERALPYALGAWTAYELTDAGVRCSIDLPLDKGPPRTGR